MLLLMSEGNSKVNMCEHSNLNSRKLVPKSVIGRGYAVVSLVASLNVRNLTPSCFFNPVSIVIVNVCVLFELVDLELTIFCQLVGKILPELLNRVVSRLILCQSQGRIPRIFGAEYISNPTTLSTNMSRPRKWGQLVNNSTILWKNNDSNSPYIIVDITSRIPAKIVVIIIIGSWALRRIMKIHIKTIRLTCLNRTLVSPEGLQRWR